MIRVERRMADVLYIVRFPDSKKAIHSVPALTSVSPGNAITIPGVDGLWRVTAFIPTVGEMFFDGNRIAGDIAVTRLTDAEIITSQTG